MKTYRVLFTLILFSLVTANFSYAQKSYKWMKKKCPLVSITDAGEMYSTYQIEQNDREILKSKEKLNEQQIETILNNCKENNWEGGMRELKSRTDNKDIIQKFKAFKVAQLSTGIY